MGTIAQKLQAVVNSKAAIKAAIEAKGVADVGDVLSAYPDKIASISSGAWTGHADEAGLKAIGWTDEDIAYYQKYGVNWNEEDDQYHLVPEDNKALYGVLTASNISTYKDRIVYLPKIDTSTKRSLNSTFSGCNLLVAIPMLDTSRCTSMRSTFSSCSSLVLIPPLDTSNVEDMYAMLRDCSSLVLIPPLDTSNVEDMYAMLRDCSSLVLIPPLNTSKVEDMSYMLYSAGSLRVFPQLDTSRVTNMDNMFRGCRAITRLPLLNTSRVTIMSYMLSYCTELSSIDELDMLNVTSADSMLLYNYGIRICHIKNLRSSIEINKTPFLEKESLVYMIQNAAPTSEITIKLSSYCYNKYNSDPDVVAALSAQPLVSLTY